MASLRLQSIFAASVFASLAAACSSDGADGLPDQTPGTGGFVPANGGAPPSNGGAPSAGGYTPSNGGYAPNGGTPGAGGGPSNGGSTSSDGGASSGSGGSITGSGGVAGGSGGAGGTTGGSGGTASGGSATGGTDPGGSAWPPATDFASKGTFATTSKAEGSDCTVFRPSTLGDAGRKHPLIVWGNGTVNTPSNYTELFNHWASHGFVIAAANTSNSGSGKEMIACLDYITKQNDTAGVYQGKLDTSRIASSGYSQGGAGCLQAGIDPRFTIVAPIAPFIVLPLGGYDPGSVAKQTHPMFMLSGTADTVAEPGANQQPIFDQAKVPIVWGKFTGATHFEILGNGNNYRGPLTAWFRYKLMNDGVAADWFKKTPCKLCSAPGWAVKVNSLWTE